MNESPQELTKTWQIETEKLARRLKQLNFSILTETNWVNWPFWILTENKLSQLLFEL